MVHLIRHQCDLPALAINAIDIGMRQFRRAAFTLIIRHQAEGRVGEPDRSIGFHDNIIRAVQPLALVAIGQNSDRTIIFKAHHAAAEMLTRNHAALTVSRMAIGVVGGLAPGADRTGFLIPFQHAVIRNIGP